MESLLQWFGGIGIIVLAMAILPTFRLVDALLTWNMMIHMRNFLK